MELFEIVENGQEDRERLPKTRPAECLGKKCLHFTGVECDSYEQLVAANGPTGGQDLPPYTDEMTCAVYGQRCGKTENESIIALHAIARPNHVMEARGLARWFSDRLALVVDEIE